MGQRVMRKENIYKPHSKTTWTLLNENGGEVEEGDLQEWNSKNFRRVSLQIE